MKMSAGWPLYKEIALHLHSAPIVRPIKVHHHWQVMQARTCLSVSRCIFQLCPHVWYVTRKTWGGPRMAVQVISGIRVEFVEDLTEVVCQVTFEQGADCQIDVLMRMYVYS